MPGGPAVAVVALSELLEEEPSQGVDIVRSATSNPDILSWLTAALPDIRKLVESRSTKFKSQ
jgi:hypothetical protein